MPGGVKNGALFPETRSSGQLSENWEELYSTICITKYSATPPLSLPLLVVALSFQQKVFLLLVTMLSSLSREKRRGWPLCNKNLFLGDTFSRAGRKSQLIELAAKIRLNPAFSHSLGVLKFRRQFAVSRKPRCCSICLCHSCARRKDGREYHAKARSGKSNFTTN